MDGTKPVQLPTQSTTGIRPLRILTWHVHGNYLYSLTQVPHEFFVPVTAGNQPGYAPLGDKIPWGGNVHAVHAEQIRHLELDCVVYQSRKAFEEDGPLLLSAAQLALPCVYIEHNPPEPHPTDTRHFFRHQRGLLVHVTSYNALMWDSGDMPVKVIEHGVPAAPGVVYTGELSRGITVINHLQRRGRRVGADIFERAQQQVPLDLIGMESERLGGLGEVPNMQVQEFLTQYRFFFTPIRYASLGLSLIEAMLAGLPILGVAATELPNVITNGVDGYVDTRPQRVIDCMRALLEQPALAKKWGRNAQRTAQRRFGIGRFTKDWLIALSSITETSYEHKS